MKKVLQDVVSSPKSIRNIPSRNTRESEVSPKEPDFVETFKISREEQPQERRPIFEPEPPRKISKMLLWGIGVVCVGFVFYLGTAFLAKATLTITPKATLYETSSIELAAKKSAKTADVSFEVLSVDEEVYAEAVSTGEKFVQTKATGKITIYNELATDQPLVKSTRFETAKGLIYRIPATITVPKKTASGPGSITVSVTADQIGGEYNIGATDFTIPGFKTDAERYAKVYGKSTAAMTGGANETQKTASKADTDKARAAVKQNLQARLTEKALKSVPEGYVLYEKLGTIIYSDIPNKTGTDNSKVLVGQKGTYKAVILNSKDLTTALAKKLGNTSAGTIQIPGIEKLQVSILETGNFWEKENLSLLVKGNVRILSTYSEQQIKEAIKGRSANELSDILTNFPEIQKVTSAISPAWKLSFPKDADRITIVNNIPKLD